MFLPVSLLFVIQLPLNVAQWYSGKKSLKRIKRLMKLSLSGVYYVIKQFSVLFDV